MWGMRLWDVPDRCRHEKGKLIGQLGLLPGASVVSPLSSQHAIVIQGLSSSVGLFLWDNLKFVLHPPLTSQDLIA